jgi:plasmid stability protein
MTLLKRDTSQLRANGAYADQAYTSIMAMTTIRVEGEVRDRLAARAQAHGRSLGAELSAMLDDLMWRGVEDGYRRLAANDAEFAAYRDETTEWTGADLGGLGASAAEEYPEYNS